MIQPGNTTTTRVDTRQMTPADSASRPGALGYHVRAGNERGINLCLWAGADPHVSAPNPELGLSPTDGSISIARCTSMTWSLIASHRSRLRTTY
jgi:hypothetical protein